MFCLFRLCQINEWVSKQWHVKESGEIECYTCPVLFFIIYDTLYILENNNRYASRPWNSHCCHGREVLILSEFHPRTVCIYKYHEIYALHSVTLHCRQTTGDDEIETIICIVIVYSACIDHRWSWMTITFECCYNGVCMYMQMSVCCVFCLGIWKFYVRTSMSVY